MKRFILTFFAAAVAIGAYAQPRAAGLRIGACGLEADYLHTFSRDQFLEGDFGMDFGFGANGTPGVKATVAYNFIWARPAWTDRGSWALYAGPGATIGYVNDQVHYKAPDGVNVINYLDGGFMLGICGQVGLEYTFWFPLQLSIDLRPVVGLHVNDGYRYTNEIIGATVKHGSHVGFYDNGLLGFAPTLSVRYRF